MKPFALPCNRIVTCGRATILERRVRLSGRLRSPAQRPAEPAGRGILWRTLLFFAATTVVSSAGSPPVIIGQPASQTIFYGDAVTFQVAASGTAPLYYQWFCNGLAIASATSSALALSAVSSNDQGSGFLATVTNGFGSVTSLVAVLTVDYGTAGPPQTNQVLSFGSVWKFDQTENLDGVNWTAPGYDDSGWPSGPGLLAFENNPLIVPLIGTTLDDPRVPGPGLSAGHAYYFRTQVALPADFYAVSLAGTYRCDDGGVLYFNGNEVDRIRMPSGTITNLSMATAFPPDPTGGTDATTNEYLSISGGLAPGTNLIAAEVHQQNAGSSDIVWGLALDATIYPRVHDTTPPTLLEMLPPPGTTVPSFGQIEVHFSEGVKGVQDGDLLINGTPSTNVAAYAPDVYVYAFEQPAVGTVHVAWSPSQQITDLSANSNRFAGGTYTYTLDPSVIARSVRINEFMASNKKTILDDTGQSSDWLELYNASTQPVDISGWYLTDNPAKLTKWRFPSGVSLLPESYLVVWASGLDHTNPARAVTHELSVIEKRGQLPGAGLFGWHDHRVGVRAIPAAIPGCLVRVRSVGPDDRGLLHQCYARRGQLNARAGFRARGDLLGREPHVPAAVFSDLEYQRLQRRDSLSARDQWNCCGDHVCP